MKRKGKGMTQKRNFKKLISYYRPYRFLFFSDLFFAVCGALITLTLPLIVRYITNEVVYFEADQAIKTIMGDRKSVV